MSEKLKKEEFLKQFGDVSVKFSNYYKYTFYFKGVDEGGRLITVSIGGDSEDIYRLEVSSDDEDKVSEFDIEHGHVRDEDGRLLFEMDY